MFLLFSGLSMEAISWGMGQIRAGAVAWQADKHSTGGESLKTLNGTKGAVKDSMHGQSIF